MSADTVVVDSLPAANPNTSSADVGQSGLLGMTGSTGGPPKSLPNVEYEVEEFDDEAQRLLSKR